MNRGWSSYDKYPRFLADVNGDGLDDIVGFKDHNVEVMLSNGKGFDS
jgi:chitinase